MTSSGRSHGRDVSAASAGILLSRTLGYVRDAVIVGVFGAGAVTDAYLAAFLIPNLIRRFAGEGVLGASFIPIFAAKDTRDRAESERFASATLSYVFVIVLGVSVLGMLLSPAFVSIFAAGLRKNPETFDLAARLLRVMFPFLLMMSVYAVLSGILNSRGSFGVPAAASGMENLAVICAALFLPPFFGAAPEHGVFALAAGVLAGGLLQVAVVWARLKSRGFSFTPSLAFTPELGEMLRLMVPTAAVLAVFQINSIVNQNIATFLAPGSLTLVYLAYRLIELPSALFGTSVGIVALPKAAQAANTGEIRNILDRSMRLSLLWMIPSAAAFISFGAPILSLLFQYGRFSEDVARQAALVLACYAPGLPFIGLARILGSAFYALKCPAAPLRAGTVSVVCNIAAAAGFAVAFPVPYKACGIGLGASLAALLNFLVLARQARSHGALGGVDLRNCVNPALRSVGASLVFAVPLWVFTPHLMELPLLYQRLLTAAAVFGSMGLYFGLIRLSSSTSD
ncbi:murein biosynthesis integral membrane protein MurJ [bacterium]|nr:murein biosynthesis integral membrane protein MurJ [bacterium]